MGVSEGQQNWRRLLATEFLLGRFNQQSQLETRRSAVEFGAGRSALIKQEVPQKEPVIPEEGVLRIS